MKPLLFISIFSVIALLACSKSAVNNTSDTGGWRLVNRYSAIGSSARLYTPSADSSVLLDLNADSSYVSKLNNNIVSQGSYSIRTDTAWGNAKILQLNNFKTTGLFGLFTLIQVGSYGQTISINNGMFMYISHDSLTLMSPLTPGGFTSYLFVKQ